MRRRSDPAQARAAALLAMLLAGAAFWEARPASPERSLASCVAPRETDAHDGRTLRVRCGGDGAALRGPARVLFGLGIDPNRADAETLEVLPGVGPARAAAIVAGRPYRQAEDLLRVRGIGPVTLRRVRGWLALPDARRDRPEAGSLGPPPVEPLP